MIAFFLFGGHHYYPKGGLLDYLNSFDTLEECQEWGVKYWAENYYDINWMHIVTIRDSDYINPYGLRLISEAVIKGKSIKWKEVKNDQPNQTETQES